jgi:hypothetical protein
MKRKKQHTNGVVFNDPEGSLRKATACTFQDRERVANHMMISHRSLDLPAVIMHGELIPGAKYRV